MAGTTIPIPTLAAKKEGPQEIRRPTIDGFKLKGKLRGSLDNIVNLLRTITFIELAQEKSAVNVAYVESRDINKSPYLFSIVKIKPDELEVTYSVTPEISPTKRRMDVIRYLLNIGSLIADEYEVDNKVLYQLIEDAVKKITESVTMDYSRLYTEYDAIKKEVGDLKKKTEHLVEQNDALMNQNYELKSENDEIKLRVKQFETMSDETLRTKIQEWIAEHNGAINIPEFSKIYKVNETKVEQLLNQLVSEGYIETVG
jgi:regulator of replication initiation timing